MAFAATEMETPVQNPLDVLEDIIAAHEWPFERFSDDELMVNCSGHWCDYSMHFSWRSDVDAMMLACALDLRVPDGRRGPMYELLSITNCKMWLGHFDMAGEKGLPVFRQTVLLRGAPGASVEQLEDLVDIALSECDRFYPAFQYVAWGGKDPHEAVEASMVDTVGEA